jgi:hypothetical protein
MKFSFDPHAELIRVPVRLYGPTGLNVAPLLYFVLRSSSSALPFPASLLSLLEIFNLKFSIFHLTSLFGRVNEIGHSSSKHRDLRPRRSQPTLHWEAP